MAHRIGKIYSSLRHRLSFPVLYLQPFILLLNDIVLMSMSDRIKEFFFKKDISYFEMLVWIAFVLIVGSII
nr:MAG TPA: hypothetical protein [Caudoviricetes sp.]